MWMRDGWVNMLYDVRNDTTTKRYRCCSPSASTLYRILNAYYLQGDVSHSRLTISTFQRVEILSSQSLMELVLSSLRWLIIYI